MRSKTVAILETRTGEHLAELIARRGGIPLRAPALQEVPDVDAEALAALVEEWHGDPFAVVIFQTGVGTRALFRATDAASLTADLLRLLADSTVIVRGPKPVGELNARGVRIDRRAAAPFTSDMVLKAAEGIALQGARVLVQRHGASNRHLCAAFAARGARVSEVATYRWSLPSDTGPLRSLLGELAAGRVDAALFTSAVQVEHLFEVARQEKCDAQLPHWLAKVAVGSIGPVCSSALRSRGIQPTFEAEPPKLGPLVEALSRQLSA